MTSLLSASLQQREALSLQSHAYLDPLGSRSDVKADGNVFGGDDYRSPGMRWRRCCFAVFPVRRYHVDDFTVLIEMETDRDGLSDGLMVVPPFCVIDDLSVMVVASRLYSDVPLPLIARPTLGTRLYHQSNSCITVLSEIRRTE